MKDKSPFQSKTIWFNLVAFSAALLVMFTDVNISSEEQAALAGGIITLVNIGLRFVTKESIV